MKHVVIVSSMGGTDPNNFLNTIGGMNWSLLAAASSLSSSWLGRYSPL